jgi:uncharacterized protein YaeQ
MALTATMYRFALDLSDVDRGVYEALELRAAQHPSESEAYLVLRVLAWTLEWSERLQMGRGIAHPEEPAIYEPRLDGGIARWIEIGLPSAERLHRASRSGADVCLYSHRPLQPLRDEMRKQPVHRADSVRVVEVDRGLVEALVRDLSRNEAWSLMRTEGVVYLTRGAVTHEVTLRTSTLAQVAEGSAV